MALQLERVKSAGKGSAALYLVRENGAIIGMVEKYRNNKTETHPWKAWAGHGLNAVYLKAFYDDGSVPDDGDTNYGGKKAALKEIQEYHNR